MASAPTSASRRSTATARWSTGRAAPASFLYQLALRHGDAEPGSWLGAARALGGDPVRVCSSGPYRPYKEILAESLRRWTDERGYPWDDADGEALVRSMRSWQPFPDTRAGAAPGEGAGACAW